MATRGPDISFVIPGAAPAMPATRGSGRGAVRVGTQRGDAPAQRLVARPGRDVVVLTIASGPTLVLSPESARDLMQAQVAGVTRSSVAARGGAANEVLVTAQLAWPGLEANATRGVTRGWMGQALLSSIEVVTDQLGDSLKDKLVDHATELVVAHVDGAVEAGVYALKADGPLQPLKQFGDRRARLDAAADGGPLLVLIHGTFVDTVSTFGKLWDLHADKVRGLFTQYRDRVYALDHPTMGASPIANALTLVAALPAGARLHLLTHSRGGLVAEVLARACAGRALTPDERALFKDAAHATQLGELDALIKAVGAKKISIERVVRVACPARGTLLASRRFDAYLSVLQWGLQLAGVPIAPTLVDFLHEVARKRADPATLPGLEAMMPGSPIVAWLNSGGEPIPGDLRVIAGDMEGDSIGSWVKTLLTDAFYWTDNDIVVQTRSMYGGSARAATSSSSGVGSASFLLDRGAKVSHFNYFANDRTVEAIYAALCDAAPDDFGPIGPLSWAGSDASGTRGAPASAGAVASLPAVFVLPGILGSNLKIDGQRIWLGSHFLNGLESLAWDPAVPTRVEPDGPIASVYDDLLASLAASHEVIPFAFDWRRPIEDEATRLADAVDQALAARAASGQPVRLLAHSMGGLVARTMQLVRPDTWKRMLANDGARFLMLGTPNGGSWAPMQTLSGDDTFGNALVAFGALFDNAGARKMMAAMPGFLQMQAGLLDPTLGLGQAERWAQLAADDMARIRANSQWHSDGAQQAVYEWGAPPQAVLDQAVALRRRLDEQAAALGADAAKMLLVIGHADATPAGISMGDDGLAYLDTPDGDGRVTRSAAMLPGVRTWSVQAEHGKLPSTATAFAGYLELLSFGQTALLDAIDLNPPAARGMAARTTASGARSAALPAVLLRSRPSRGLLSASPPAGGSEVLGLGRKPTDDPRRGRARSAPVRVSVYNGNLKFVREPLLLGHYRSLKLTGTEAVVDALVAKAMSRSLNLGLYPDPPGSVQIFSNKREDPENVFDMARPASVIVAGLGEEGKLRALDLVQTVRQAILAYAQRVAEETPDVSSFELAATLLGSGGAGISVGAAAQQIAQGAIEANRRLQTSPWPQLEHLKFVELYLERAADAWRALQMQSAATTEMLVDGEVRFGPGAKRRSLDSGYRGSAYDFISALTVDAPQASPSIAYTLDTMRARTEVRAQRAQGTLLRELVLNASNDTQQDPRVGRTLFNLLVPVEMEPFLAGTNEMVIEVDPGTAAIPWELLDTRPADEGSTDRHPWAIRCKLLRKLRLENFRGPVTDASIEDDVLVIGQPLTDPALYPPLPGALAEAEAVAKQLSDSVRGVGAERVHALTSGVDNAQTIINALYERRYRVVHIAGHGSGGEDGGVVLSGTDTYLGANEVHAMRTVPELVFLNCCHLAGRDAASTLRAPYDRAKFAANIAEELIRIGVRCVIAAGWAVEDGPAEVFATSFYGELLGGARFIEAVASARTAAWNANPQGNTWAAYQCYGDPEWAWQRQAADALRPATPMAEQFAAIASPVSLTLALESIAVDSEYGGAALQIQGDRLAYLDATYKPLWGAMGAVAEGFGVAYIAVGDTDKAIEWYRRAVDAADGSASFKAVEQLGNWLVRRAETCGHGAQAAADVKTGIALLEGIAQMHPTAERHSLLGSAYKRKTMIEWHASRATPAAEALAAAVSHFGLATEMARKADADDLFYPAKNAISCELRRAFIAHRKPRIDPARFDEVRRSMQRAAIDSPTFWSAVGQTELQVLDAIADARLARIIKPVLAHLDELKQRVPSVGKWRSISDEARFTLEPYAALRNTAPPEKAAAQAMLAALAQMGTSPEGDECDAVGVKAAS